VTHHILEDMNLQQHNCEHLKSHTIYWVLMLADKLPSSATYRRNEDDFQILKY